MPPTQIKCLLALLATTFPLFISALPPSHQPDQITEAIPLPIIEDTSTTKTAQPVNIENEKVADNVATIFACDDVFWAGNCSLLYYKLGSGDCNQLNGKTSSIGPDRGFTCTFYKNGVCRDLTGDGSDSITLVFPGEGNLLRTSKGNFNDALLGYQCFAV